jgi:hypothetical protein
MFDTCNIGFLVKQKSEIELQDGGRHLADEKCGSVFMFGVHTEADITTQLTGSTRQ